MRAKSGADLSHGECVGRNAPLFSTASRRRPGTHNHRRSYCKKLERPSAATTNVRGYGPGLRRDDDATSQNEPAQIRVLGEIADMFLHVIGIDLDGLAIAVGGGEGNLVEHALHHGL